MKLEQYIKDNYGTQERFAKANGYKNVNQVSVMVSKGNYYVVNGRLMIAKRGIV